MSLTLHSSLHAQKTAGIESTGYTKIDSLVQAGEFTKAREQLGQIIQQIELSEPEKAWQLGLQADILRRIQIDFNRDSTYIWTTLGEYFPDLTEEQVNEWEESGELEMLVIDGEKRYFRNSVWNLFRINEEAEQARIAVDGPRVSKLFDHVEEYFTNNLPENAKTGTYQLNPAKATIRYTLTVDANAVPAGEVVKAWLPFPREDAENFRNIELQESSQEAYQQSPVEQLHSTIYMEKVAVADTPTVFSYVATYEVTDYWRVFGRDDVQAYDTTKELYQTYTAERLPHIPFSNEMKELAADITEGLSNPYDKAFAIWRWIGENIPWTSAVEYSTMPSISTYCALNGRGDCGMKAMLFITLCRISGVPAKWQSGWYLYEAERNLHDWAEVYFEGIGWVPVDPDFNHKQTGDITRDRFFFGGRDRYRFVVNEDFSADFFPAKEHPRSETVDFQRGEVEWNGGNLYFDQWSYQMRQSFEELD